jgi:eukaryotic-like serine/threonine-protein kinase
VSDPATTTSNPELRAHVERVLSANYELGQEIGRGGMGIVYLARDKRLKRPVAVKLLPPELGFRSEIRRRFLREAETAAQLSHPSIVPIYTVEEADNLVFFIMGYVSGENLAKRLHEQGPFDIEQTRRIVCEVAGALAYAHARGVVHRDIKPDNILIDAESGRAMVTDFGIARALSDGTDTRLTATGIAIGTPAYMSPEQCAGDRDIDGRSDLYSLGVVAYQMLSGELPFSANNTPALLIKHISERPAPIDQRRRDVPVDLARSVMLLLEKEPDSRFPSANALVTALETRNVPNIPAGPSSISPYRSASPATGTNPQDAAVAEPTVEELSRWNADPVVRFRRKLAPFIAVNAVLVPVSILHSGNDPFMGISLLWSVYMAYRYAKLWTYGYDWRDVFRQKRERMFFDVAAETIDDTRALFDADKRAALRGRMRARARTLSKLPPASETVKAYSPPPPAIAAAGAHGGVVREAALDLDEIRRQMRTFSKNDREMLPGVERSAEELYSRVAGLAVELDVVDRQTGGQNRDRIDQEINQLEAQANPFDGAESERRVRRLAQLRRERRTIDDLVRRRKDLVTKLEDCRLALRNMKLDVVRLRSGGQTYHGVTMLAERAMHLARDVDGMLGRSDDASRKSVPSFD